MKILYVSLRINSPDGSSVHGRSFADSVARLGHEIQVYPSIKPLAPTEKGRDNDDKDTKDRSFAARLRRSNAAKIKGYLRDRHRYVAEFIDLFDGLLDSIKQYRELSELVRKFRPDIMVYRAQMFHFAPLWICKAYQISCVLEVNAIRSIELSTINARNKSSFITRWAERYPLKRADYVASVSRPVKAYVDKYIRHSRSVVVPNGVDTDVFDPARFSEQLIKKELKLEGKIVLGYTGSYKAWHGLDVAVEVIDQLVKVDARYHLLLIGSGDTFDDVKRTVAAKSLQGCVTQIPRVTHDDMPRYLAAFDYALMTYPNIKGFYFSPLKMFEYLAMGIAVVATDIGQISELIGQEKIGILVYPPAAESFVTAVRAAEQDRQMTKQIRLRARQITVARYSWRENARRILNACEELVAVQSSEIRPGDRKAVK